ncbi:MAG TPA: glycosyltransferase family 4 protein [Puia sp.]
MKILFLSHHWTNNSHHSKHSGFQRLVVHAAKENEVTLITWGREKAEYTDEYGIHIITIKGSKRDFLFLKRMGISLKGRKVSENFDAVHALYSDCTFFLKKNSFAVTFHVLPGIAAYPEFREKLFLFLKYNLLQKRAMRRAREIICVSKNLLSRIPEKYRGKARFIPHGVDTEFWDPALSRSGEPRAENNVLCVGSHGLDKDLLKKIILGNPQTPFVIVGLKNKLAEYPNVSYLYNLPDEKLRDLYSSSGAVLKPLAFSTANNSILEAMAMGTTILASRIPGVTDYLDDSNCLFIDTLNAFSLEGIESRKPDPGLVRESALRNFSWNSVLMAYLNLYYQQK